MPRTPKKSRLSRRAATYYHALTGVDTGAARSTTTSGPRVQSQGKRGGNGRGGGSPPRNTSVPDLPAAISPSDKYVACIDIPALPLQLLAQRQPEWASRPMAVVAEDRPQGLILWVNEKAYRSRVLPGMRYAAGLSICRELCAAEVPATEIETGGAKLLELLLRFSPYVEPSETEPGVFWIDASGLIGIESSLQSWAARIQSALREAAFVGHIVVGFQRFNAYALARSRHPTTVFDDPEQERLATRAVRFDRLHLDPKLRQHLAKLDIHTVGEFLQLPVDGLARRFGKAALKLHQDAAAAAPAPLDPTIPAEPFEAWIELEYPEHDAYRLTFAIQRVLPLLLQRVAAGGHGLSALTMALRLDNHASVTHEVRTASATLELDHILELVRLKLESTPLDSGVVEIDLRVRSTAINKGQLDLFTERPRRDLPAAERALARVRAEFGRLAVVVARLQRAHLPEASFSWEPHEQTVLPTPLPVRQRSLIRRIFDRPVPLPQRGRHEPDGWLVRGPEQGSMSRISGPYTVSGGWWVREVHRDYHFVETAKGDVMWVFYDRRRRRWFLQGQVE
jgi:protein ImuB